MTKNVKPVPEGYHTITPSLVIKDGARAIEFYKKAFGAKEIYHMDSPDGTLMHAELQIGDSRIMLGSEPGDHPGHDENCAKTPAELKGTSSTFYLYVEDADAMFKRAVSAGAKDTMPMTDMFWGDRLGGVRDPFGYIWSIATHTKNVTPEQMKEGAREFFAKAGAR